MNSIEADFDRILANTARLWDDLRGARVFLTGGTGFIGTWLLESFIWANDRFQLNASVLVLTRDSNRFMRRCPHLASHRTVRFHEGDVRSFRFPPGTFSHVIHAATEASAEMAARQPLAMFDTIVAGTRRALDFAVSSGVSAFLFTSSGAVYGEPGPDLARISEDVRGAPDPLRTHSCYGEGKRAAELLCALYHKEHGLACKIARCFAFVGPYLPLDRHFAIGNFIADALAGRRILVRGDGTPLRSYLYSADLAAWLWTILLNGASCRPYNVGSERPISIADLAATVSRLLVGVPAYDVLGLPAMGLPANRYVPCTERARRELGLEQQVLLEEAICKTAAWAIRGRPRGHSGWA